MFPAWSLVLSTERRQDDLWILHLDQERMIKWATTELGLVNVLRMLSMEVVEHSDEEIHVKSPYSPEKVVEKNYPILQERATGVFRPTEPTALSGSHRYGAL